MQLFNLNHSGNNNQSSTDSQNSQEDQNHIYTLESLIQTLEEVSNHLTK